MRLFASASPPRLLLSPSISNLDYSIAPFDYSELAHGRNGEQQPHGGDGDSGRRAPGGAGADDAQWRGGQVSAAQQHHRRWLRVLRRLLQQYLLQA